MTTFVPRADWGHTGARGGYTILPVSQAVVHHTPGQEPATYNQAVEELHQILGGHLGQGWGDIGYTWLVWDAYAFEGRGYGRSGAHAPGANSTSIGIAFILDGRNRLPTPVEWQTARDIMDRAARERYATSVYTVAGHRDHVATACPGDLLYAHLGDWWDLGPATRPEDDLTPEQAKMLAEQTELLRKIWDATNVEWAQWKYPDGKPIRNIMEAVHYISESVVTRVLAGVDAEVGVKQAAWRFPDGTPADNLAEFVHLNTTMVIGSLQDQARRV